MNTFAIIAIASSVVTGLIGGVFFAFSVFVMRALVELPVARGVAAMQRINVTVINPLFLGAFLGAAPLLALAAYLAVAAGQSSSFAWLAAAFITYVLGSVAVTMVFNVPRNNRLASAQPESPEAADYWPVYVREWLFWNHVRCVASLMAAAGAAVALAVSITTNAA